MLKGDSPLVLTLIVITSLLSPIITPLVFFFLTKGIVQIELFEMFVRIFLIVVLPFILANIARKISLLNGKNADFYSMLVFLPTTFIVGGIFFSSGILENVKLLLVISVFLVLSFIVSFLLLFAMGK